MVHDAINEEIDEQKEKLTEAIDILIKRGDNIKVEDIEKIKEMLENETDLLDLI